MSLFDQIAKILAIAGIHGDPSLVVPVYAIVLARIAAAIPFIPFLGGESVPGGVRISLAMLFALVLYPLVATPLAGAGPPGLSVFFAFVIKEAMIGAVFGLLVQIVFSAFEAAGSLLESTAGLKMDEIFAPQLPTATGPFSMLLGQAAIVLYLAAGVHRVLIQTLADSYLTLPLDLFPRFQPGVLPLAIAAGRVTGEFLVLALRLSAPVLLLLVLIKVGTGLIFRASFAGMREDPFLPLSAVAVMGGLFLGAGVYAEEIARSGAGFLVQFSRFIGQFR